MAKTTGIIFGVVFIIIGLLAFVDNPIVGMGDSFFLTNVPHDLVHIISGLLFLVVGFAAFRRMATTLKIFGAVYLLVAILGFLAIDASGMGSILGIININTADNWLHVVLGIVILASGFLVDSEPAQDTTTTETFTPDSNDSFGENQMNQ